VGLALTIVERLAIGAADGQAGDRHRVASPGWGFGFIGDGKSAWRWPPGGISESSQSQPSNEPRQTALGAPRIHGELLKIAASC
jgi:hypothetical protein